MKTSNPSEDTELKLTVHRAQRQLRVKLSALKKGMKLQVAIRATRRGTA
jgi:hypothetical protein